MHAYDSTARVRLHLEPSKPGFWLGISLRVCMPSGAISYHILSMTHDGIWAHMSTCHKLGYPCFFATGAIAVRIRMCLRLGPHKTERLDAYFSESYMGEGMNE